MFSESEIAKALEPNRSPVADERTYRDDLTGAEIDVTLHADGSVTLVAERLLATATQAVEGEK